MEILELEYIVSEVKSYWVDFSTDEILYSSKTIQTEAQKEKNVGRWG